MKQEKKTKKAAELPRLARQAYELGAQLPVALYSAHADIAKAGADKMMASGVIVSISALGGRELAGPFCIGDGLSAETVAAIRADIVRSLMLKTVYMPAALRDEVEKCRADYLANIRQ